MQLRIKEICEHNNISIAELGRMIGVTKSSIHTILNNGNPSLSTLDKIATALKIPVWQLFVSPQDIEKKELTALIEHNGQFYKATTLEELKVAVFQLFDKNNADRIEEAAKIMREIFIRNYHSILENEPREAVNKEGEEYTVELAFTMKEMTESIRLLPDELKTPFILFINGYTYSEIAEKLDLPVGTVKSRVYFARQELLKIVAKGV